MIIERISISEYLFPGREITEFYNKNEDFFKAHLAGNNYTLSKMLDLAYGLPEDTESERPLKI